MSNNDLIDAGFSQAQVIALQDYLQKKAAQDDRNIVTSDRLNVQSAELRLEMAGHKAELKKDNADLQLELKQDFVNLQLKIETKFTGIETKFTELHRWIIGFFLAIAALMVALMTYFNHR